MMIAAETYLDDLEIHQYEVLVGKRKHKCAAFRNTSHQAMISDYNSSQNCVFPVPQTLSWGRSNSHMLVFCPVKTVVTERHDGMT